MIQKSLPITSELWDAYSRTVMLTSEKTSTTRSTGSSGRLYIECWNYFYIAGNYLRYLEVFQLFGYINCVAKSEANIKKTVCLLKIRRI